MTAPAPRRRRPRGARATLAAAALVVLPALFAPAGQAQPSQAGERHAARAAAGNAVSAAVPQRRVRLVRRLRATTVTRSTISVRWTLRRGARVARFRVYRDGKRVASLKRGRRRHTFRALACGRTYRLALEARSRTGRRLGRRAVVRVATAACDGVGPGGSGPGGSGGPGGTGGSGGGPGLPGIPWSPPVTPPSVPFKPASVFMAPGASSTACTVVSPCGSFERAYLLAKPGDQIELAGGFYSGQQEIPADPTKVLQEDVIFRPAPGANVRIQALDVFGNHVEVRDVTIDVDFYVKCQADDVTLRGSKAQLLFIRSADNVSIIDTEFGPSDTISQIGIIGGDAPCEPAPTNILLDGVYMHDFTNDNDAVHMECLTVQSFVGMVIRRSRFHHCEDFNILFKARAPTIHSRDLLIENSWFDLPWPDGSSAIQFSDPGSGTFTNVLIRNNSFAGTLTLKPDVGYTNTSVIGNVGTNWGGSCSQVASSHNIWANDGGCTATDRQAPTGFVSPNGFGSSPFDMHLKDGAAAIGHANPANHPATDIDGESRPKGGAPDAGADERA
jgi:hypothetical protein